MTETTNTPEIVSTEKTREELEAEILALRAEQAAPANDEAAVELSTRDRSPVKPQDHKPKGSEKVAVEFEGVTYTVSPKAIRDLRFLDLLEREQMNSALRLLLGDDKYEEFVKSITDDEGYADAKFVHELLEKVGEAAGVKNS